MLKTHIKYLIKTVLEIAEIILAKVFAKIKKTNVVAKIQNTGEQSKTFPRKIFWLSLNKLNKILLSRIPNIWACPKEPSFLKIEGFGYAWLIWDVQFIRFLNSFSQRSSNRSLRLSNNTFFRETDWLFFSSSYQ